MRVAVIQFPGSNCDQDALHSLRDDIGVQADYVWHDSSSLRGFDAVFVPGGFSYGDYLRCGAMASHAPIMAEIKSMAKEGAPVIGVCNGFQVLCEAGLLSGALMRNASEKFVCKDIYLQAENRESIWTRSVDRPIRLPIAHGEGRYICDSETLVQLLELNQIAFRYVNSEGIADDSSNPNGSMDNIAGVLNERGNVLGLMPHPERYTKKVLGGCDGIMILEAFQKVASPL
jgi:phosphoribosylformylglycinamidine synthase